MDLKNASFSSLLRDAWILYSNNLAEIWKVYGFLVLSSIFMYFLNDFFEEINSLSGQVTFSVAIFAVIILSMLVNVAYYLQIKNVIDGKPESVQKVFFNATPIFWIFVLTTILHAVLVLVASFFLFIPGVIFYIYWIFFRESLIYRNMPLMKALDYSLSLVRHRWWKVLAYFIGFLAVLAPFYIMMYLASFAGPIVEMLFGVGFLFFSGWISIAQIMFFFHLEQTSQHPHFKVTKRLTKSKYKVKAAKTKSARKTKKKAAAKKAAKSRIAKKKTAKRKATKTKTTKRRTAKKRVQKRSSKASSRRKKRK